TPGIVAAGAGAPAGTVQVEPSVAAGAGGNYFVAWKDSRLGGSDIYFSTSDDGGVTFGPATHVNGAGGSALRPSVAAASSAGLAEITWTQADSSGGADTWSARGAPSGLASVGDAGDAAAIAITVRPNPGRSRVSFRWPAASPEGGRL